VIFFSKEEPSVPALGGSAPLVHLCLLQGVSVIVYSLSVTKESSRKELRPRGSRLMPGPLWTEVLSRVSFLFDYHAKETGVIEKLL